jgi:hypothetical protein
MTTAMTAAPPGAAPKGKAAARQQPASAGPAAGAELARLRGLVEEQHRRLRLVRGQAAGAEAAEEENPAACAGRFEPRCAKPRLTRRALARLIEQAARRLELESCALGAAILAGWPGVPPELPVLRPSPGLGAYGLRELPEIPNAVFALFGRTANELKAAVERVLAEQQSGRPFAPVFLTDCNDFSVFRDQRLAFEYFPLVLDDAAGAPDPTWAAYFLESLGLSMRRWGVRRIVVP